MGLILAFIVDSGPVFRLSGNLLPQKLKNPHLFYSYGRVPPRDTFRNCKPFTREHRFRLLGHIPHTLVDDGALFPFSLSEKDTTSVH